MKKQPILQKNICRKSTRSIKHCLLFTRTPTTPIFILWSTRFLIWMAAWHIGASMIWKRPRSYAIPCALTVAGRFRRKDTTMTERPLQMVRLQPGTRTNTTKSLTTPRKAIWWMPFLLSRAARPRPPARMNFAP